MAGYDNIREHTIRNAEQARAMGKVGGVASVKAKRARKTFRESLKLILGSPIPKESPLFKKMKAQMKALGIKGDPLVQDITLLGMVMKSAKDHNCANFLRDTIGEKPVESYEDVTPQSPVVLGMIPVDMVNKAMAVREARNEGLHERQ